MTTYDPRTIEVVRCFVDGIWNGLPSRRLDYFAPEVDLWLDDAEEQGLLRREPSVMFAIDGSTVLVATPKGARAVKLHDEEYAAKDFEPKAIEAIDWADYRNGPDGELLTAEKCQERFRVSGPELSKNKQAVETRRKNPEGRGFVYRYDVVSQMSNRKSADE
jgi:hypothetical protein